MNFSPISSPITFNKVKKDYLSNDLIKIFDRFYQSSSNKKAEGGLGIGLALSMEFVKLMSGKMWVESNTVAPNQGSVFYFQFPKKEVLNMAVRSKQSRNFGIGSEQLTVSSEQSVVNSPQLSTILLVEDNHASGVDICLKFWTLKQKIF